MSASGKRPDELRRRAIRLTPGRPGRPGPARGVFAARGRRAGGRPRGPARPGSVRGFGSVAGDRPGTTTEGARRTGEPASGVRGPGAGARSGGARRIALWRRSVSARRADPPSASTSAREELRGPCRICAVLTGPGCRTGPVHLTRAAARSRPPSKRSISDAAPGSRGDPRPGGPSRFDAGAGDFREDPAAAGLPAGGPRVARMRRGCGACGRRSLTGAGPGRTVRTTASRRPGTGSPLGPLRRDSRRRPPKPALGGRLHPRADPARGSSLHRLRHGACARRPHRRPGPPAAARGTDNAAGAPGQAIRARKDRGGGDPRGPGAPQRPRISVPVHRALHRTTRRRGHRSHRPEPWAPPTRAPPPRPRASPCKRGARSGATAPGGTATTPGTATAEHRYHRNRTTTAAPPATAQPPTKPRTIHTDYRRPLHTFEQTITAALSLHVFKTTL